ncbi:hypothetical protein ACVW0Y_000886 [Pseudomonas sp. TE3786]
MAIRLAKLEEAFPEIRQRLARVETTLLHRVTKADLINEVGTTGLAVTNFPTEITRLKGSMIQWFIGTTMFLVGGFGAIAFGLARALN